MGSHWVPLFSLILFPQLHWRIIWVLKPLNLSISSWDSLCKLYFNKICSFNQHFQIHWHKIGYGVPFYFLNLRWICTSPFLLLILLFLCALSIFFLIHCTRGLSLLLVVPRTNYRLCWFSLLYLCFLFYSFLLLYVLSSSFLYF